MALGAVNPVFSMRGSQEATHMRGALFMTRETLLVSPIGRVDGETQCEVHGLGMEASWSVAFFTLHFSVGRSLKRKFDLMTFETHVTAGQFRSFSLNSMTAQ